MWMGWGPELYFFAMRHISRRWASRGVAWRARQGSVGGDLPDISLRVDSVMQRGDATWDESLLLFLERSGFVEETYHTFSYSPAPMTTAPWAGCCAW